VDRKPLGGGVTESVDAAGEPQIGQNLISLSIVCPLVHAGIFSPALTTLYTAENRAKSSLLQLFQFNRRSVVWGKWRNVPAESKYLKITDFADTAEGASPMLLELITAT